MTERPRPLAGTYEVAIYENRGTKQSQVFGFRTLPVAFKRFHHEVYPRMNEADTCILLSLKTGKDSGITLASKSTDEVGTTVHRKYYELEFGCDA